jgi:hypothetical protein
MRFLLIAFNSNHFAAARAGFYHRKDAPPTYHPFQTLGYYQGCNSPLIT